MHYVENYSGYNPTLLFHFFVTSSLTTVKPGILCILEWIHLISLKNWGLVTKQIMNAFKMLKAKLVLELKVMILNRFKKVLPFPCCSVLPKGKVYLCILKEAKRKSWWKICIFGPKRHLAVFSYLACFIGNCKSQKINSHLGIRTRGKCLQCKCGLVFPSTLICLDFNSHCNSSHTVLYCYLSKYKISIKDKTHYKSRA